MIKAELISARVEPELADRIKAEAEKDRRTVSQYVRNLIADTFAAKSNPQHGASH